MATITVKWLQDREFEILEGPVHQLRPKELMLLAMGKCAALTALALLDKMHVSVTLFEVTSSGELSGDLGMSASVYTSFRQRFNVQCAIAEDCPKVLHALELTHDKYCGVSQMYSRIAPVSLEIVLNGNLVETQVV